VWLDALWGFLGSATNCGVVFLEASRRVKTWPWAQPHGPGGGVYIASVGIQLFVGATTTTAVATTPLVSSGLIAFGIGLSAPTVVKKIAGYVETLLPSGAGEKPKQVEREGGGGDAA
jgi:hypothetical protein